MTKSPVALLDDSETGQKLAHLNLVSLFSDFAKQPSIERWKQGEWPYLLLSQQQKLQLISQDKKLQPLAVDFYSGAMGYRGHQNVRNELLVKAVLGRDKQHLPTVIDATAGLGRDSFLLAMLGCQVTLFERNPVVVALLADGIDRYGLGEESHIAERLNLQRVDAFQGLRNALEEGQAAEVVYLDPMFPKREKSALVKKEMQFFKDIVGPDQDSAGLLTLAKSVANKKVVVKRASKSEYLDEQKPTYSVTGKASRFDIYQC